MRNEAEVGEGVGTDRKQRSQWLGGCDIIAGCQLANAVVYPTVVVVDRPAPGNIIEETYSTTHPVPFWVSLAQRGQAVNILVQKDH